MTGGIAMSACTLKFSDGSLICCPVGPASNAVMPDPTPGLYLRTSSRGSDDDEICGHWTARKNKERWLSCVVSMAHCTG